MRVKLTTPRICAHCGAPFSLISKPHQRFCSPYCGHQGKTGRPAEERFWEKVDKTDTCWLWTGSHLPFGYGLFYTKANRSAKAHRFSWELANGPIPAGLEVCHSCDTPGCVRVDHLFLGTHKENFLDATKKGRMASGRRHGLRLHPERRPRGEQHGSAKLTATSVLEIRRRAADGENPRELASEFGVHHGTVLDLLHGRTWQHLT